MKLWVTGLNHRTAPVEVRERLAFQDGALSGALADLRQQPGVREGLILSTCNRVEVAVAALDESDARTSVETFLSRSRDLDPEWLRPYLYGFGDRDAIRHLFRVAASLDSMIVGEPQILGQLKSAYSLAKAEGCLSGYLDSVVTHAFSVAKRVRTETDIGSSAVSISYAAVELAKEIFGSLQSQKVMLIGAGKMADLAARNLKRSGVAQVLVTNRTQSRAARLAEAVGGAIVPYESFRSHLKDVDIVVTSSGVTDYLLTKEEVRRVIEARRNRPMFLIDIAVPRNIHPDVHQLDNVFLYDIDDLQKVIAANMQSRSSEALAADHIVMEEVDRLESSLRVRLAGPIIAGFQEHLERIRMEQVEKMRSKLGEISPQQEQILDQMTRAMIAKIAHKPIAEMRRLAANPGSAAAMEAIRRAFGGEVE